MGGKDNMASLQASQHQSLHSIIGVLFQADMEEMVKREITRSAESLKKTEKGTPKKTKGPPALKKSRSNRLFTT